MEAPAELLAALSALVTALALLLAWLLVRRGPAASSDPAPAPPEPAPHGEASGTPAPSGPGAPEPVAAPDGPEESEGPGESAGPGERAGPAEAEEQAAEARQVRSPAPLPIRPGFPAARVDPCRPPRSRETGTQPRAGCPQGGQSPRPAGKEGPARRLIIVPHRVTPRGEPVRVVFCCFACFPLPGLPEPGAWAPSFPAQSLLCRSVAPWAHTPPSPPRPLTGSQIHVRVAYFKASYESCLACEKNKNTFLTSQRRRRCGARERVGTERKAPTFAVILIVLFKLLLCFGASPLG